MFERCPISWLTFDLLSLKTNKFLVLVQTVITCVHSLVNISLEL